MITVEDVERALEHPFMYTAQDCHGVSIALLQAGLVQGRVARGWCAGVVSQHSWIVLGDDCYAEDAEIVDATLWSYRDDVEGVWEGTAAHGWHVPHQAGFIWDAPQPTAGPGPVVHLTPREALSTEAQLFLDVVGPLDILGWHQLIHSPVQGWPAAEIIAACDDTPQLKALIPVDILGMLTDRNPGGLYLAPQAMEASD